MRIIPKLAVRRAATLLFTALLGTCATTPAFAQDAAAAAGDTATALAPLPLGQLGRAPWSLTPVCFVIAALLVPLLLWAALAWKQAFDTDPQRWRRRGVRDLRQVLRTLRGLTGAPDAALLHRWRDAAARAWNLRLATPTAEDLGDAIAGLGGDAVLVTQWCSLWRDSERSLFAADGGAPPDWRQRALAAGEAMAMPPRAQRLPDRRAYWLPVLLLSSLGLLPALSLPIVTPAHADVPLPPPGDDDPAAATIARLEAAQAASLAALGEAPMDWAAHENVARYGIHLQDWDAAVAHGLAAFLLHASPETRAGLRYAYAQSAMADPMLKRLLGGTWYERLPTALSPRGWQQLALLAGLLLAAGLVALVLGLYRRHAQRRQRLALWSGGGAAAALGLLLTALSLACWNAYGDLRGSGAGIILRAANLAPTPTDLVPRDETRPIAAGRIVVYRRTFLGWQQVDAGPALSGWLRGNAVLPLYGDAWPAHAVLPPSARAPDGR